MSTYIVKQHEEDWSIRGAETMDDRWRYREFENNREGYPDILALKKI